MALVVLVLTEELATVDVSVSDVSEVLMAVLDSLPLAVLAM